MMLRAKRAISVTAELLIPYSVFIKLLRFAVHLVVSQALSASLAGGFFNLLYLFQK